MKGHFHKHLYIFLKRCDGEIVITSDLECFTFNKMLKLTFSYFGLLQTLFGGKHYINIDCTIG